MSWKNELKNNITEADQLQQYLKLSSGKLEELKRILSKYPLSITNYYFSLINFKDEHDPVKKMCIPLADESFREGSFDTSGEAGNTILKGLQHKYSPTAMVLSTNLCAMYCRHCFRKRMVGTDQDETMDNYRDIANYVKQHEEISNVLISGGDSFLNSNKKIEALLQLYTDIDHLDYIRFGTRIPVVFPNRITTDEELLHILKKYNAKKQIYIITQFNHPNEITAESKKAVRCLLDIGIPIRNQTVLLKEINDDPKILTILLKKLTAIGVVPYYVFQCRPVRGVKTQFQIPLKKAFQIIEEAKFTLNGLAKNFRFCMSHVTGKIEILGLNENNEMFFKYHQAKNKKDNGRIFTQKVEEEQCWLN